MIYRILSLFLVLGLGISCNAQPAKPASKKGAKYVYGETISENKTLSDKFFSTDTAIGKKVDSIYNSMSTVERAGQMIMVASSEVLGFPYSTTVSPLVNGKQVGSVLFLKGKKNDFEKQRKELDKISTAGLKPIYACDCEPTLLHNKFIGQKKMNATANLSSIMMVNSSVDTINKLMTEMGLTINFAPIADIAANKSIINNRSFGNSPKKIDSLASAFVAATQGDNKAATIKHFPGHGAVKGDSHKQSVYIDGKMTELETFKTVIKESSPMFVMVGHIVIKNNPEGYNTENGRPATTSKKIITDLLREKMGFKGIIVTDAMNMQASKNYPDSDWEAAKAGADLILMPLNASALNKKISKELESNSNLGKQFEASVKRMIRLKVLSQK